MASANVVIAGVMPTAGMGFGGDGPLAAERRGADLVFGSLGADENGTSMFPASGSRRAASAASDSIRATRGGQTDRSAQSTDKDAPSNVETTAWTAAAGALGWFAMRDAAPGQDDRRWPKSFCRRQR